MSKEGAGPAFPQNDAVVNRINNEAGMSLRDYFAARALATMKFTPWTDNSLYWGNVAKAAYLCADAMLAERAK